MRSIAGMLIVLLYGSLSARAQISDLPHLHSETVLSGIDVSNTNGPRALETLVKTLGQPTRQEIDAQDKRVRHYYWEGDGPRLTVTEMTATDKPTGSLPRITSVEVWGTHPSGDIGVTGAGLALGATLSDTRRIYPFGFKYAATGLGPTARMFGDYTTGSVSGGGEYAPSLEIHFKKGVVVYIKLTNPCPFVCF